MESVNSGKTLGDTLKSLAPGIVAAGVLGAAAFVVAQKLAGFSQTIPQFMGASIVSKGGYPEWMAGIIGWGVHLGVSLSYATLFALTSQLAVGSAARPVRWGVSAVIAFVLGVVSTLVTAPAIAITIGILSGSGLPDPLPVLNTGWGFVFWNHFAFFGLAWAIIVALPDLRGDRA